jgi:hypothetical protein
MILAETTVGADDFWKFWCIVSSLTAMLASLSQIISLFLNRRERREVSFAFDPAGKEEFEKHLARNEQEHRDIFARIGGVERGAIARADTVKREIEARLDHKFDEFAREHNESRTKLHERINQILQGVARLEGRISK